MAPADAFRSMELIAREAGRICICRYKWSPPRRYCDPALSTRTVQLYVGDRGSVRVTPAEARLLAAELLLAAETGEQAAANG